MALLEALVALLILAFGVLGLLWMHQQALVQQRQQLMRSVAIGIADEIRSTLELRGIKQFFAVLGAFLFVWAIICIVLVLAMTAMFGESKKLSG